MDSQDKKQCGNCRFFSQYYVKFNCFFMQTNYGKCKLKKIISNPRIYFNSACEQWEPVEIALQERKQAINEAIINISKKLDEIAAVLTDKE